MGAKEKSRPLVTVLMPVYNAGPYVGEAIESILAQTMSNFEFLIINDGSTDESLSIVKHYQTLDPRIRLITRSNKGLVPTLDEGIENARGEFIARMDADDISLPTRLEEQLSFLRSRSQYAIVGTFTRKLNEDDYMEGLYPRPTTNVNLRLFMAHGCALAGATIMVKREVFEKFGKFDPLNWPAEDYDLWARITIRDKSLLIYNLPKALYLYRENTQGISGTNRTVQRQKTEEIGARYRAEFLKAKRKFITNSIHKGWLKDTLRLETPAEKVRLMEMYYEFQHSFIHDQRVHDHFLKAAYSFVKLCAFTGVHNYRNLKTLAQEFTS